MISIIGPSGTGKSTFLRCLNLLESPSGGSIIVDGQDLLSKKTDVAKIRQKMGMVFQSFNLFNHLTIMDNLCIGPVKLLGKSRKEAEERAMELLSMVGLAEKANAMPSQLPGLAEWNQQMLEKIRKTSSTNSAIVQIFFLSLQKKVSTKIINYE